MRTIPKNYSIALQAALQASEEIMRIYQLPLEQETKADGSPVTSADLASSAIITAHLKETNLPVIGEESIHALYSERKHWSEVWIVDPLDGTKEYIKRNDEFAVNIALIKDGNPIMGIIASPVNRSFIFGGREIGSFYFTFDQIDEPMGWQQLAPSNLNSPLIIATSRSVPDTVEKKFITELTKKYSGVTYIRKGSSLKFFDLALGLADIYPRFAPTMEWDIAAGQAILEGIGGQVHFTHCKESLIYNKENLYNPYFIAKTKAILDDHF